MKELTAVENNPEKLAEAKEAYDIASSLLLSYSEFGDGGKMFYAHFLMRMNVQFCYQTPNGIPMPSAGVSITDRINLYINPEFFLGLNPLERMELLEHEIDHIIYLHPTRAKDYIGTGLNKQTHKLFNIATDANINENLPHITKEFGVTIDRINKELAEKGSTDRLNPDDHAEVHYEILLRNQMDEDTGEGQGGQLDDHGVWQESSDNAELVKAVVKEAADQAAQATGHGSVPNHIAKQLAELGKSVINWQAQLRQFIANAQRHEKQNTRSRRNRRYGILQAGKKRKPLLHIACIRDTSGSVSDEAIVKFSAEIEAISKQGVEITMIDADCEVQNVSTYKRGQAKTRYGYGGTAYQPAITKAKELEVDGIVYFGDMDAADTPTNPKIPFLWVVVGTQNPPGNFGKTIRIND